MKNYKLINFWSVKDELKNIEKSSNFIMPEELNKISRALYLKKHLEDNGFFTTHYQKEKKVDDTQKDINFVFNAQKQSFTVGDSSPTFYGAIFSVYLWLRRCGEVKEYEFV